MPLSSSVSDIMCLLRLAYCKREVFNMASNYSLVLLFLVFAGTFLETEGKLTPTFYSFKCPKALSIVQEEVVAAIKNETRIGASLLRLHFHDCFVNVSHH